MTYELPDDMSEAMRNDPHVIQAREIHNTNHTDTTSPTCVFCVGPEAAIRAIFEQEGAHIILVVHPGVVAPPDDVDDGAGEARAFAAKKQAERQYGQDHRN